jgi:integrase
MKLTQRAVDAIVLPPGKREAIHYDQLLPGFGLRLRASGSRTFVVSYRIGKKDRRMTLGSTAMLRLEAARIRAGGILAAVRAGRDPAGERVEARARAGGDTFAEAVRRHLAHKKTRLRARSYATAETYLLGHFKPLHGLSVARIDRRTVAGRLSEIAANNGPAAADRARASLSAFFTWAWREGLVEANPVTVTARHGNGGGRDRVLSDTELTEVWRAAGDSIYGTVVRVLILTGQRREEIGALRWSEVDVAAQAIRLPAERCKNGRPHDIPLSAPAMRLIAAMPRRLDSDMVFGIRGFAIPKRALDGRVAAARQGAGVDLMLPWVLHDLRRTCATGMAEIGVAPHVIEAVLNHVSGHKAGVAGIYNRATYEREKRQALDLWAEHVMALVEEQAPNAGPLPVRRVATLRAWG